MKNVFKEKRNLFIRFQNYENKIKKTFILIEKHEIFQ